MYEGADSGRTFAGLTEVLDYSSPMYTFPHAKRSLEIAIFHLHLEMPRRLIVYIRLFTQGAVSSTRAMPTPKQSKKASR